MPIFTWANGDSLAAVRSKLIGKLDKVIDVKTDFGALGNNAHDDGPNIQAALDALKTTASPRASALYFPPGSYVTNQVLNITNTVGVHIFGDGAITTAINYRGSATAGNSEAPATGSPASNLFTPVIMTNGFSYSTLSGLRLNNVAGTYTCGIYFFQDATASKGTTNQLRIFDVVVDGAAGSIGTGFLVGFNATALCSEISFEKCLVNGASQHGFRNISSNALNNNLVNCGGVGNFVWCSVATGTMNVYGASLANNTVDIEISGSNSIVVAGSRTESFSFVNISGGSGVTISGCVQIPGNTTTAATFLQTAGSSLISLIGNTITASGGAANQAKISGASSQITMLGNKVEGNNPFNGLVTTQLSLINNYFSGTNPLDSCTAQIIDLRGPYTTVATLPAAGTRLKGVRGHVTDASAAASTANFSSTVTGGGANTVPVWCDGTNWRIG